MSLDGPSLNHAIGDRSGGRVRLRTVTLEPYGYVSCEYPEEFLAAMRMCMTPDMWVSCDDGVILQVRHIVKAEIATGETT